MTEEYWANSQFSVARYYGGIQIGGKSYKIVNKQGATIFELSDPDSPYYVGDGNMAIPQGEPADLVLKEWIPMYKKLGRDKTIECVEQGMSLKEAKKLCAKFKSTKLPASRYSMFYDGSVLHDNTCKVTFKDSKIVEIENC